jgi:hypothetical protein
MLDPKDFLTLDAKSEEIGDEVTPITGTFMCQHCNGVVNNAQINLTTNKIKYVCLDCESVQEAKL